jgi:hypothetical protein
MFSCPTFKKVEFVDLLINAPYYGHLLNVSGAIGFKKINITEAQQYELARRLGDVVNWLPNSEYSDPPIPPMYETFESELSNKTPRKKLLVEWDMGLTQQNQSVGSLINNIVFSCSKQSGSTLMIDMRRIFSLLKHDFWKTFISQISWVNTQTKINGRLVKNHRNTNQPILQFSDDFVVQSNSQTQLNSNYKFFIDGRELDQEEIKLLIEIMDNIIDHIYVCNLNLIEEWTWDEKDLLILDNSCMLQATKGGFKLGARITHIQKCAEIIR